MLHASGSDDGVGSQLKVPGELQDKTTHINEGTGTIPGVPDVPKDQTKSENKSEGDSGDADDDRNDDDSNDDVGDDEDVCESDDDHDEADDERTKSDDEEEEKQDDEFVHTPDDYVPTNDETNDESKEFDEEEYEELYGDVNISLKDTEPDDKEKGDVEITVAEVVSMLDINVQHEVPRTSPLLTILVSVIPEHTVVNSPEIVITASSTTISSLLSLLFPHLQQLTPIPTPIITEATTSTTVVSESETHAAFHRRITNLEKDVKELKIVDHSTALLSTIKSKVPNSVKEYLGKSLDDALHKVLQKHLVDITKEHSVPAEIVERLR
ncbi:hypothetical protein Tco_0052896 [Tanacetum coccineum]